MNLEGTLLVLDGRPPALSLSTSSSLRSSSDVTSMASMNRAVTFGFLLLLLAVFLTSSGFFLFAVNFFSFSAFFVSFLPPWKFYPQLFWTWPLF